MVLSLHRNLVFYSGFFETYILYKNSVTYPIPKDSGFIRAGSANVEENSALKKSRIAVFIVQASNLVAWKKYFSLVGIS